VTNLFTYLLYNENLQVAFILLLFFSPSFGNGVFPHVKIGCGKNWPKIIYASRTFCVILEQYLPKKEWSCFSLVCAGLAGHVMRSEPRLHVVFLVSFSTEKRGQRLLCDQTRHLSQVGGDPISRQEKYFDWIVSLLSETTYNALAKCMATINKMLQLFATVWALTWGPGSRLLPIVLGGAV